MRRLRDGFAARLLVALALSLATVGCGGDGAPNGVVPGQRLPWPEATEPVRNWAFATAEEEIALETGVGDERHSVTVWCVVVEGRLYVATDSGTGSKRWVRLLDRNPEARVGIAGRVYRVRAEPVRDGALWDAVVAEYARKYGPTLGRYDFPRAGDLGRGRIFELVAPPA